MSDRAGTALARLAIDARPENAALLSGPYSGTQTYLIRRPGGDVVLKLVPPDAPDHARARALREARFFAELAPEVPLHLPRLLATCDDPLCLLFEAYPAAPPAREWSAQAYGTFASDLALLHARFWGDQSALRRFDWLRQPEPGDTPGEVEAAREQWVGMARQPRFADLLSAQVMSTIEQLLALAPAIGTAREGLPLCLCHGDCHAANFLLDPANPGALVWADWQEVGFGSGPEELSFFVQRAVTDGAELPEAALLAAYHLRLSEAIGPVPFEAIARIADASELRTRLLQWPHYLAHLPSAATALSIRRISVAADRLGLT